jgi:hypothetical protein
VKVTSFRLDPAGCVTYNPKPVDHRIEKQPFNTCVLRQERFSVRWNGIRLAAYVDPHKNP